MYNVFIIRVEGSIIHTVQPKAPDLKQLQSAVAGYIETIPYFTKLEVNGVLYKRGRAYANEEGLLKGMPLNVQASKAWIKNFKYASGLVGDVIFYAKGQSS
jgi:hypothetical protein